MQISPSVHFLFQEPIQESTPCVCCTSLNNSTQRWFFTCLVFHDLDSFGETCSVHLWNVSWFGLSDVCVGLDWDYNLEQEYRGSNVVFSSVLPTRGTMLPKSRITWGANLHHLVKVFLHCIIIISPLSLVNTLGKSLRVHAYIPILLQALPIEFGGHRWILLH